MKIKDDAYGYSYTVVIVFGILGNILVILSILRQKKNMLKNDYYFLVLHLAICDLQAALIMHMFYIVDVFLLEEQLSDHFPVIICNIYVIGNAFEYTGVGMMLIISLLRYRAIVHPFKPAFQSMEIESRLWSSLPCWIDCRMWGTFAAMLYKLEPRERCL